MKKNDENTKKKGIGIRLYAFVVLILALLIAGCVFLLLFRVQDIRVTGNEHCEEQVIRDWVMEDVFFDNSLLALWKNKYEQGEAPAMTESVTLSLASPWSLKAEVREKAIIGYVKQNEKKVYFDSDGYVLEISEELYDNIFQVTGLSDISAEKGEQIQTDQEGMFEKIAECGDVLKELELFPSEIRIQNEEIYLQFSKISVRLGVENLTERISQLPDILKKLSGQSGTLHLEKYSSTSKTVWFKKTGQTAVND